MQFLFCEQAGENSLVISGEMLQHIKALRLKTSDSLRLRNLHDDFLYMYTIAAIERRELVLELSGRELRAVKPRRETHLAWCVVEPKIIEKTLPQLNELGVGTLTLVWCEKSQRNFRLDEARMRKIVIASCEQCGRSAPMTLAVATCADFAAAHPDALIVDFGGEDLRTMGVGDLADSVDVRTTDTTRSRTLIDGEDSARVKVLIDGEDSARARTLIVGAEGGFGGRDYAAFNGFGKVGFNSELILRSETAILLAAAYLA